MPSPIARRHASAWSIQTASLTARLSKDSGKFTNVKANRASNAARAFDDSRTAADRLTGARVVSEDDYPQITRI